VGSTTAGSIAVAAESTVATRMSAPPSFDVADFPVPHGREEEWRFTPMDRLRGLHDGTAVATGTGVRVDVRAPEGVTVETVGRDDARLGRAGTPVDRVAAQAYSAFEKASVVTVPKETVLTEPIRIAVHGEGGVAYGHQVVELGAFAEAVVVIDHTGDAVLAANVDYVLGDGARLTVVCVQDWDDKAVHVGQHNTLVGRDASFKSVVVTFGGDVVRLHPRVAYAGPGGEAELFGLYFTDRGQHQEHRLMVDHNVPHCTSNVVYKGALQGEDAHAVWIGDVLIEAAAEGTDTYEMNRNLVLTDGARVDSVPNLEIETGEIVGAGHASATGRFDDEQLFYLMARGIEEHDARRLVVRGFFAELVQQIGVPDIEERLLAKIEEELEASVA
jgi:Fe-S cluster assembly protein SufD